MRTFWLSAFIVSSFGSFFMFFELEDPNSWSGFLWLVITWANLSGAIDELRKGLR